MPSYHNSLPLATTFSVSINCCDDNHNNLKVDEIMMDESKNDDHDTSSLNRRQPFISGELWYEGRKLKAEKQIKPWNENSITRNSSSMQIEDVWGDTTSSLLLQNNKNIRQHESMIEVAIEEEPSTIPLYTFYGDHIWTQQPSNFATQTTVTCSVVSTERPIPTTNSNDNRRKASISDSSTTKIHRSPLVEVVIGWGEGIPETRIAGIVYSSLRKNNEGENDDDNFSIMSDVTW